MIITRKEKLEVIERYSCKHCKLSQRDLARIYRIAQPRIAYIIKEAREKENQING